MIHFYDEIITKMLETIKDSYDCIDILNDLNRINEAISNVNLYGDYLSASRLDLEMRQKYPSITHMINYANSIRVPVMQTYSSNEVSNGIVDNLKQDHFGIIAHAAIKKQVIKGFKDLIQKVD